MFGRGRLTCAPTSGRSADAHREIQRARYNGNSVERGRLTIANMLATPTRPPEQASCLHPNSHPPFTPPLVPALPLCLRISSMPFMASSIVSSLRRPTYMNALPVTNAFTAFACDTRSMTDAPVSLLAPTTPSSPFPLACSPSHGAAFTAFPPKNMADLGDIPQDLHATLEGLTCAASPLPAFSCGSARTANTGNIIICSRDLVPLCTTLPRRRTSTYLSFKSRTRETPPPTV